ncbi:phage major capsid protein [Tomitella gaofuii]|uniref:phage major capsid protein n=1 Tax=Tomitella gaofuii TaxID=2760083 RepID=UPI0015FB7EB6|nr:hypothetical protein [Tomitella gaofuii]
MTKSIVSIFDGPQVTVSQLLGSPTVIPTRVVELVRNNLLVEAIFRNGGKPASPVVQFTKSAPVFLDGGPEVVGEFGEIPVFGSDEAEPDFAVGHKIALGVRVSREMRDFNQLDRVNKQVRAASNTVIRSNEKSLQAALTGASLQSVAATDEWSASAGTPRHDIAAAIEKVNGAVFDGDSEQPLGYLADSIVVNPAVLPALMDSSEFKGLFTGNIADQNIAYTGVLPSSLMGMTVFTSRFWPKTKALVLQRGITGFYADPRPMEATGMYGEGGGPNGGPTESWRSDVSQIRAVGVDEPLSACWISGIAA